MEALYTSLRSEIRTFEEHVQSCQAKFDLHTLYKLLVLLTENSAREVDSIEQLVKLAESTKDWPRSDMVKITFNDSKTNIQGYVSWFMSYVGYLRSLKEMFDNKIVFPLCENLYVNEDMESVDVPALSLSESMNSISSSESGLFDMKSPYSMTSITETAKELFNHRRKWALLLKGGTISDKSFAHESLLHIHAFGNIASFEKVLRLIPDIFYKSLTTTSLARQWVDLHERRSQSSLRLSKQVQGSCQPDVSKGQQPRAHLHTPKASPSTFFGSHLNSSVNGDHTSEVDGWSDNVGDLRAKLRERREELMFLLWRAERAEALEMQVQETTQRIVSLEQQLEDRRKALDNLQQRLEQEGQDSAQAKTISIQGQELLQLMNTLDRQLKLERFQKKILQSDWLLELAVRPSLIRHIDMVRERCCRLEMVLKQREPLPSEDNLQPSSETDSETLSLFSEPSRSMSNIFTKV
ncbi:hypothetical protein NDU88_000202 [Pleurodeles waltl]|uniref:Uncharacterized protein n=1 Tax=Pleurodeles waltl TaxID=8319 RepID=A0AAV7U3J7_PLEWA|nr:hypothetical protein NDU88_000202 [Pleurodeles waltl]